MALIAGIDEAGYGPILGPLVVSVAVFEVPDDLLQRSLWSPLRRAITSKVSKRDRRLPIVDSKRLYNPDHGLGPLETSALTMLSAAGLQPCDFPALIKTLCPQAATDFREYPWYRHFKGALPVAADATLVRIKANAVSHSLRAADMRFVGAASRVLAEGHYNRIVAQTRNKATVLWTQTLQLIERALHMSNAPRVRVVLDRQGARVHSGQALMTAFDVRELDIEAETPEHSVYTLRRPHPTGRGEQHITIEFVQSGESHHLPIALASIFSKYVREACMLAFNSYWQEHVDSLKRTAGYYQDGQRFLKDIEPAVQSLAIDRSMLVRSR